MSGKLQKRARARMKKTGESYCAALRFVRLEREAECAAALAKGEPIPEWYRKEIEKERDR